MRKPGLAIFKGDRSPDKSSTQDFMEYVNRVSAEELVALIKYADLFYNFSSKAGSIKVGSSGALIENVADAFHVRDFRGYEYERHAISRYLSAKKQLVYNSEAVDTEAFSKLEQNIAFFFASLPIPRTLFSNQLGDIEGIINFPSVVKSITGANGQLNFLVRTQAELTNAFNKTGGKALIQEYIENDGDYRVIIMYGEPVIAYLRARPLNSGNHLNNIAQGGQRRLVNDHDVIELALKGAKVLRRKFCGMDIMRDKNSGSLYLLESNIGAGMHILGDGVDKAYFTKAAELIKKHRP